MDTPSKNSGVYKITAKHSGNFYIGSALNFYNRWAVHLCQLRKGTHANVSLLKAFRKYGQNDLEFSILETVSDKADLIKREQHYIDTLKPAYNINPVAGNLLGFKHSAQSIEKMRLASTGKKWSPEQREKFLAKMVGRKHSEERKAKTLAALSRRDWYDKVAAALRGKTLSPETRAKISATKRAQKLKRVMPEETRKKLSVALRGNKNGRISEACRAASIAARKVLKIRDDTRQKMRQSRYEAIRNDVVLLANYLVVMGRYGGLNAA